MFKKAEEKFSVLNRDKLIEIKNTLSDTKNTLYNINKRLATIEKNSSKLENIPVGTVTNKRKRL